MHPPHERGDHVRVLLGEVVAGTVRVRADGREETRAALVGSTGPVQNDAGSSGCGASLGYVQELDR
jgi:hypothetical protein